MFESMYAAKGVGLAAPQIGFARKIAVIDVSNGENPADKLVLINPRDRSRRRQAGGRRRLPQHPRIPRAGAARPSASPCARRNAKGEEFEMTGEDLLARAFLHETDHLNGRLYITHISALKRDLMKRKIKKLQRAGEWD